MAPFRKMIAAFLILSIGLTSVMAQNPVPNGTPKAYAFVVKGTVAASDAKESDGSCLRFTLADKETTAASGTAGLGCWNLSTDEELKTDPDGEHYTLVTVPVGAIGQMGFSKFNGKTYDPIKVWAGKHKGVSNVVLTQPHEDGFSWLPVVSLSEKDQAKATSAEAKKALNGKAEDLRKRVKAKLKEIGLELDAPYLDKDPYPAPKAEEAKPKAE